MSERVVITNLEPRRTVLYAQSRKTIVYAQAAPGPIGPPGSFPIAMSIRGPLVVGVGVIPFPLPYDVEIVDVTVAVATAPTGADLIFDVRKNGMSVFPTAPRPRVLAGEAVGAPAVPDVTLVLAGDVLTVDVVQVGSIQSGANATLVIEVV